MFKLFLEKTILFIWNFSATLEIVIYIFIKFDEQDNNNK